MTTERRRLEITARADTGQATRNLDATANASRKLEGATRGLSLPFISGALLGGLFGLSLGRVALSGGAAQNAIARVGSALSNLVDSALSPFLPQIYAAIGFVERFTEAFREWYNEAPETERNLVNIGVALIGLTAGTIVVSNLVGQMVGLGSATIAVAGVGGGIPLLIAAMAAAVVGGVAWQLNLGDIQGKITDINPHLAGFIEDVTSLRVPVDGIATSFQWLIDLFPGLKSGLQDVADFLTRVLAIAVDEVIDKLNNLIAAFNSLPGVPDLPSIPYPTSYRPILHSPAHPLRPI